MPKFMLILSSRPGVWNHLTAEQTQRRMEEYQGWVEKISPRRLSGEKLGNDGGKILSRKDGKLTIVDGPYADTKEVIGGFMVMRAESLDEAIDLVSDAPMLEEWKITIRETDPMGCGGD